MRRVLKPRRVVFAAALLTAAAALAGCDKEPADAAAPPPKPELEFVYTADGGATDPDDKLTIYNRGTQPVAPVLKFIAIDEAGKPIPTVTVHAALGTDTGRVVVPAGGQAHDYLQFYGDGFQRTADLDVEVVRGTAVTYPAVRVAPTATALNAAGAELRSGARAKPMGVAKKVRLTNENDVAITVRYAYVVWNEQTENIDSFHMTYSPDDLITVPARGHVDVDLEGEALALNLQHGVALPASVEAYYSV